MGDPSEELQRMEALSKEKEEAAEEAEYRAKERGHVRNDKRSSKNYSISTVSIECRVIFYYSRVAFEGV